MAMLGATLRVQAHADYRENSHQSAPQQENLQRSSTFIAVFVRLER